MINNLDLTSQDDICPVEIKIGREDIGQPLFDTPSVKKQLEDATDRYINEKLLTSDYKSDSHRGRFLSECLRSIDPATFKKILSKHPRSAARGCWNGRGIREVLDARIARTVLDETRNALTSQGDRFGRFGDQDFIRSQTFSRDELRDSSKPFEYGFKVHFAPNIPSLRPRREIVEEMATRLDFRIIPQRHYAMEGAVYTADGVEVKMLDRSGDIGSLQARLTVPESFEGSERIPSKQKVQLVSVMHYQKGFREALQKVLGENVTLVMEI